MATNNSNVIQGTYQQLDYRSLSISLLGTNNKTMTGTVNLSAIMGMPGTPEEESYDDQGAAYYVCAVILVYGLSIVSLIGSLAKKKMKDNKIEQDEVQINRYLNQTQELRDKTARDNYRQLKQNVIKLVEENKTPTPENSLSDREFHFPQADGSARHLSGQGSGDSVPSKQTRDDRKLESLHLLGGQDDSVDKGALLSPPPPPDRGSQSQGLAKSLPFQRLQSSESPKPEERITVVQTMPSSKSDPVGIAPNSKEQSILIKEDDHPSKPKYRWSLGADGNIWIMQVNENGEEKLAPPPNVDSLPPPPSPEYIPPVVSQRYSGEPETGTPRSCLFNFEDERPKKPPGAARVYTQGQYPPIPFRHGSLSSSSSGGRQPTRGPQLPQAKTYSMPTRTSVTPPRDSRSMDMAQYYPGGEPGHYQALPRESSRSPSPREFDRLKGQPPSSFPRGPSLSPPSTRYGPKLSTGQAKSRDRSRSPKGRSGKGHNSPQNSRSNQTTSAGDEDLMQVTCV